MVRRSFSYVFELKYKKKNPYACMVPFVFIVIWALATTGVSPFANNSY